MKKQLLGILAVLFSASASAQTVPIYWNLTEVVSGPTTAAGYGIANGSYIDSIDQDLGTASSPVFRGLEITEYQLIAGEGLFSSGNLVFLNTTDRIIWPSDGDPLITTEIVAVNPTANRTVSIPDASVNLAIDGSGSFAPATTGTSILKGDGSGGTEEAQSTGATPDYTVVDFSSSPPATPTSPGTTGQVIYGGNYLYICVATDTWLRAQLLTW